MIGVLMKVYLDNGATTMVPEKVVKRMEPYFTTIYGNPSSLHQMGQEAKRAMHVARNTIAKKINANTNEIVFVASGSESDNLAIKGTAYANPEKNHIITTKIEHHAVERSCGTLEKQGYNVTWLDVDREGFINLEELEKAMTPKTLLVSIIHANNEIGTIQDIDAISEICKKHNVLLHLDAMQSFTKVPINVKKQNIDLLSFSAHKIHGPKGIGVLYVREGLKVQKLTDGGNHEHKLRAGTENVPYMVGFAEAVKLSSDKDIKKMAKLRDRLIQGILDNVPSTYVNGYYEKEDYTKRLCFNANIRFDAIEGESLGMLLDSDNISTSTGSACSSKSLEPSHVLTAIRLNKEHANGSIRFTLSRYTTEQEIDYVIEKITKHAEKLRNISPLWKKITKKLDN